MAYEQYTPTTGEVRALYAVGVMKVSGPPFGEAALGEFERMMARVRRDAAREALDGLFDTVRTESGIRLHVATRYRDAHYPEETLGASPTGSSAFSPGRRPWDRY